MDVKAQIQSRKAHLNPARALSTRRAEAPAQQLRLRANLPQRRRKRPTKRPQIVSIFATSEVPAIGQRRSVICNMETPR